MALDLDVQTDGDTINGDQMPSRESPICQSPVAKEVGGESCNGVIKPLGRAQQERRADDRSS